MKYASLTTALIGSLRWHGGDGDGDGNVNVQKGNGLKRQSNDSSLALITLSCTFLCRHCKTTAWKYLISRFVEDVNERWPNFLSLSELGYGCWEFSSRRVRLHLAKYVSWNNHDRDWKNANSLFKGLFRGRRRRGMLNSLITATEVIRTGYTKADLPIDRSIFASYAMN